MNWLWNVLVVVQIVVALTMIGLILMQHGKGADMGATFGSGASGSLFGASGSANFMSRSTAVCAGIFFACTLTLTHLSTAKLRPGSGGGSVLDKPSISASAPLSGAALVPAAPAKVASAVSATAFSAAAAVTASAPAASAISLPAASVAASAVVSTPASASAKAATASSSVPQK
jgi:preprotein translocase subunit SecG